MNKNTVFNLAFATIMAVILISLALMTLQPVGAAPPAAPTPVANILDRPDGRFLRLYPTTLITADTNSTGFAVMEFDQASVQTIIDQATNNTTTIKAQYSNDNSNWFDGDTIVSSNVTSTTVGSFVPLGWRYLRFNFDLSTADEITLTVLAVLK